jgi:hypothetical protein
MFIVIGRRLGGGKMGINDLTSIEVERPDACKG